jgi:Lar family restriction alleviation protein
MTMADPIREALEPCPFCGGTRIRTTHIRDGRACGCGDCGAELHAFHPDAEAKAIKLWNTRTLSLTTKAIDDELVEALTPSGDTKAAYMGEFSFSRTRTNEDGDEYAEKVYVPWTTIKEMRGNGRGRR